jgi:hypothetical protein
MMTQRDTDAGKALVGGDAGEVDLQDIIDDGKSASSVFEMADGFTFVHKRGLKPDSGRLSREEYKRYGIPDNCVHLWVPSQEFEASHGIQAPHNTVTQTLTKGLAKMVVYKGKPVRDGVNVLMYTRREVLEARDRVIQQAKKDHSLRSSRYALAKAKSELAEDVEMLGVGDDPRARAAAEADRIKRQQMEGARAASSPTRGRSLREGGDILADAEGLPRTAEGRAEAIRIATARELNRQFPGVDFVKAQKDAAKRTPARSRTTIDMGASKA